MKINVFTKLHPNEKLRNWSRARTFGGTTKEHSLYILGLRRKSFYIIAGSVGVVLLAVIVGAVLGIQAVLARVRGNAEEITGVIVEVTRVVTRENGVVTTVIERSTSILGEEVQESSYSTSPPASTEAIVSTVVSGSTISTLTSTLSNVLPPDTPSLSSSLMPTSTSSTTSRTTSTSPGPPGGGNTPPPDGQFFTGEATFYAPGLGSCGMENTNADFIAALSRILFDAANTGNPNNNPNCNRKIFIRKAGGVKMVKPRVGGKWFTGAITSPGLLSVPRLSVNISEILSIREIDSGKEGKNRSHTSSVTWTGVGNANEVKGELRTQGNEIAPIVETTIISWTRRIGRRKKKKIYDEHFNSSNTQQTNKKDEKWEEN